MRPAINIVILASIGTILSASLITGAADPSDEKLLLGFEESDFEKLSKVKEDTGGRA